MQTNTDSRTRPWHGVMVATPITLRDDCTIDYDAYADHVRQLIEAGCDGVVPNGSLGEYQTLTDSEREQVVRVAVEAAGDGNRVMPGVAAYGSAESRRWAEQAAAAGSRLRAAPAAQRVPLRRGGGARPLRRCGRGRGAGRRVQQPVRHQGGPDAGSARPPSPGRQHRGRQGVQR